MGAFSPAFTSSCTPLSPAVDLVLSESRTLYQTIMSGQRLRRWSTLALGIARLRTGSSMRMVWPLPGPLLWIISTDLRWYQLPMRKSYSLLSFFFFFFFAFLPSSTRTRRLVWSSTVYVQVRSSSGKTSARFSSSISYFVHGALTMGSRKFQPRLQYFISFVSYFRPQINQRRMTLTNKSVFRCVTGLIIVSRTMSISR